MLFAGPAAASVYFANGAGPLPSSAQQIYAVDPTIAGNLTNAADVNTFEIYISNPADFSAFTVPLISGVPDTELFLFNSLGMGVYMNDDISGGNTLSCLPSEGTPNPCPYGSGGFGPLTQGLYFLSITRSANLPYSSGDPSLGTQKYIFTNSGISTGVNGPDLAQGGAQPVIGYDGGVYTAPNYDLTAYQIELTGTSTPEPFLGLLTAGAAVAFVYFRRRESQPRT